MPRYNFLDEAGLKKYHQLAGYSEIPLEYTSGKKLNTSNGEAVADTSGLGHCVTDYIGLPVDAPYYLKTAASSSAICFYDENNNFLSGKTLSGRKYKLVLNTENTKAVKFRVSFQYIHQNVPINGDVDIIYQVSIQALHDSTTKWLYGKINTDISETNKLIVRLHADYGFGVSPNPIEKDISTTVKIHGVYFRFDGEAVTPSGSARVVAPMNTDSGPENVTIGVGSIINNSNTITTTGQISDTTNFTMIITHLGMDLKKSITVNAYYPIYYKAGNGDFHSNDEDLTRAAIVGMYPSSGRVLQASSSGYYTITTDANNHYTYITSPYIISTNKVFNASTGFQFPMEKIKNISVTYPNGTVKTYYVYRSTYELDPGTYKIQIKS